MTDVEAVQLLTAIYNGWENSRGAKQEFAWAVLREMEIRFESEGM